MKRRFLSRPLERCVAGVIAAPLFVACNAEQTAQADETAHEIIERVGDAATGRALFVEKGCVSCHSVNGVGGKAAAALDAQTEIDPIDPVAFAARMWRGAPAMVELQSLELGYVIWLTADEIVHLATFAADAAAQKELSLDDLSEAARDSILNERFWEVEDWSEFLNDGQEGFGEPDDAQSAETPDESDTP